MSEEIGEIVDKYRLHENDKGSVMIQLIFLEVRKKSIIEHLTNNKKDYPAKRALLKLLAKIKKFLKYLEKERFEFFQELKADLKMLKPI